MKICTPLLLALTALPIAAPATRAAPASAAPPSASATPAAAATPAVVPGAPAAPPPGERLGEVSFPVSCSASVRAPFSRGVALLHDFWYDEAQPQFERIAKADPDCAVAHWGIAMSVFPQIWGRPDPDATKLGRAELQAARAHPAKTAREREYIAALSDFYEPVMSAYHVRVERYSAAMAKLYARYPEDTDAGAFYALSLLAAEAPNDTSLAQEHRAMAVLNPLFAKHPDHPGVVHYIIHACDTPSLAKDGLAAARHYGEIAPSGPHAVHMPGHIFARLGMWQADIDANRGSVAASQAAEAQGESGAMDQFHSDDFLLYAYLQSGQDAAAKALMADAAAAITHFEAMPNMADHYMVGMFLYFRAKFPVIFDLEMRDWKSAAALEPISGAPPQTQTMTYWARAIAAGHLRQAQQARAALAEYDALHEQIRKGPQAYLADSMGTRISRGEMLGWAAFAEGNAAEAQKTMRDSADLQDKVGQGEVDIPAREMLADMLMELGMPREALAEYQKALQLSPNRFNGLYNAGRAAEALGDAAQARSYYLALLESTGNGAHTSRPELDHVKAFASSTALAAK